MEKYRKGKNVEEPLTRESIPIPKLSENFLWMHVQGGTKIHNVLQYALENFEKHRSVVWTGSGPAVKKTITCAEIMKREYGHTLHQINKICYRVYEEYWEPIIEDLDQLVVKRRVPMIHVLLSMDPLDPNELGYQAPGKEVPFKNEIKAENARKENAPSKEMENLGQSSGGNRKYRPKSSYQKQSR